MASIGENVRRLRDRGGLAQSAVADALGIDASGVSRVESGRRQLSAYEVGLLVEALGWDAREIVGIERPREKMAVAARLRDVDGSADAALQRAAEVVEIDALLDDLGVEERSSGLTVSCSMTPPASRAQALREGASAAERVRNELGHSGPIVDLIGFVETHLGMDVLIEGLPDGCDGVVAVGEQMAIALVDNGVVSGRQRFTLAHELGHAVMGDVLETVRVDRSQADDLAELRAQAFASNLLMPEMAFRQISGDSPGVSELAELMVTFGVSWTACLRRCETLELAVSAELSGLSGNEVLHRSGRSDAEIERLEAPISAHSPSRLRRRVEQAYTDALVGAKVVGIALGLDDEELHVALSRLAYRATPPPPTASTLA